MPTWVQKIGPDGRSRFVLREKSTRNAPAVLPDIEDYTSPVDGKLVSGRKQRREDLKRNGCVEYDPGMKQEAIKRREQNIDAAVAQMIDRMRWYKA